MPSAVSGEIAALIPQGIRYITSVVPVRYRQRRTTRLLLMRIEKKTGHCSSIAAALAHYVSRGEDHCSALRACCIGDYRHSRAVDLTNVALTT